MSDATRNFSLRLSADDYARLERIAARFDADRTGALRLLIRRAAASFAAEGCFTAIRQGRTRALPVSLTTERSAHDAG